MPVPPPPLPSLPRVALSTRQWPSFVAHAFKATFQQHHAPLLPLFRQLLPPDGVVMDVGAHAGQFAKLFSRLVPEGRVYAFEPGRYARLVLTLALAINRTRNVAVFPVGLGQARDALPLTVPVKQSGSLGFGLSHLGATTSQERPEMQEAIDVITLDAFCATLPVPRIDLIKADIEGWELHMLRGAAETLRHFRPALYLEVYNDFLQRAGDSAEALAMFLSGLGYVPHVVDREGRIAAMETMREGDLLWLPTERRQDVAIPR